MPEVVEVCLTSLWLNYILHDCTLEQINILGGRYSRHPLKGLNLLDKISDTVKVRKVNSKGKFLWFELDKTDISNSSNSNKIEKIYILNKFGLEGVWLKEKDKFSHIEFVVKSPSNVVFSVYFSDSRNFGSMSITNDKKVLDAELNKLADDFLKKEFNSDEFYERIRNYLYNDRNVLSPSRSKQLIIKVLMDQTKKGGIGSGLGNYLAVEALYEAKISPHTTMYNLYKHRSNCDDLSNAIKHVIKVSFMLSDIGYLEGFDKDQLNFVKKLRNMINNGKLPKYNFHKDIKLKPNETFKFKVYRQKLDPDSNPIIADKIITGRTTYWSPIQKEIKEIK